MKYVVSDVLKLVHPKTRLFLQEDFKIKLINTAMQHVGASAARSKTGRRALSRALGLSDPSISDWIRRAKRPRLSDVLKLQEITGISESMLRSNITAITAYLAAGKISVPDWKLTLDEDFAEWLGLLVGDGSITKYDLRFCNNNFDLLFYFADCVERFFGVSRDRFELTIRAAGQQDGGDVAKVLASKGFKRIKLEPETKKAFTRRKPNISLRISSRILSELVTVSLVRLQDRLKDSPGTVKAAYIRGFAAAEGTVSVSRSQRTIAFAQKDMDRLKLIEQLLKDLGIFHVHYARSRNVAQLAITTRRHIERYRDIAGFGHHQDKNEKLNRIIAGYKMYQVPYEETYQKIEHFIQEHRAATSKDIADVLGIKRTYANKLLNRMSDKSLIDVDKSGKFYIFSQTNKSLDQVQQVTRLEEAKKSD